MITFQCVLKVCLMIQLSTWVVIKHKNYFVFYNNNQSVLFLTTSSFYYSVSGLKCYGFYENCIQTMSEAFYGFTKLITNVLL